MFISDGVTFPPMIVGHLGKKRMTAATAKAIGLALGTGPKLWVNLQTTYDLFHAPDPDPAIARRAKAICHAGN